MPKQHDVDVSIAVDVTRGGDHRALTVERSKMLG
jgi:hypothetical protein